MNKAMIDGQWQHLRMIMGVARRLVEQLPEDQMDFRPTPDVRSASELVVHMYSFLTDAVDTVEAGKHISNEEPKYAKKADMLKWMDSQVEKAFAKLPTLTEAQLAVEIECWGEKFFGWLLLTFPYQEVLHHRGQFTVYLRLLKIQPIFIYGFGEAPKA